MKDPWISERWRILTLIAISVGLGLLTGYWTLAIALPACGYMVYNLWQLRRLERWIRDGAKRSQTPDMDGVWNLIVKHIRLQKRKDKQRKQRVSEILSRYNATVRALPYATVVLNGQFEIQWANPAASRLLGIDNNRDLGRRIDNLLRAPEFRQFLHNGDSDATFETSAPTDDTKRISMRQTSYKGHKLITARDISDAYALQRARKEFVANASHELRTPLTVIMGYLEMFDEDSHLPTPMQNPVSHARSQAQRMQQIIEDLLNLSRLESSPISDNAEVINMESEINRLVEETAELAANTQHTVSVSIQPDLQLEAVRSEFRSVLGNLFHNALKHTPPETHIELRWYITEHGDAVLSVRDDGDGIPAEHIPHLTERFYRVDVGRSRASGGTGLGLAIVKHIMQRHGGELQIKSTPGEGTQFTAIFPPSRVISAPRMSLAAQAG